MKDYYQILGISKGASDEDIKKAYHKLAHEHHPDKTGGNEAKFKELNEAYQVLGHKEKRAQYDRFGRVFEGGAGGGAGGGFGFDPSQFGDLGDLSDLFGNIFGGFGFDGASARRAHRGGADLETRLEITLEEAFRGLKKPIQINTMVACSHCSGLGHFPKEGSTTCSVCDGRGEIHETQSSFFGAFSRVKICSKCLGAGKVPKKICAACGGGGRLKGGRDIEINLAAGISDGQIIKVSGMGEAGERGEPAGDLYVEARVKPHAVFVRAGDDLIIKKSTSMIDLLFEKPITVNAISGKTIEVQIPENWNIKEKLRIKGEGMPRFGFYGRGDLYIDFDIKTPKRLSSAAKKLLEDLKKEL